MPALLFALVVLALVGLVLAHKLREARRADFIRTYGFPRGLIEKLQQRHAGLPAKDAQLVARALRQFFLAHLKSGRQFVSMPSQVTDELWHEFILYTRHYDTFCRRAFGRFMHHTPAVVLGRDRRDNAGLRRTWWWCCKEENINPRKPTRLPLLFALDAKLGVAGGFVYAADCAALRANGDGSTYCGGDFGSTSVDGSTDGFGDGGGSSSTSGTSHTSHTGSSGDGGGSSADGGGDGGGDGSGCGGGCGGGGD